MCEKCQKKVTITKRNSIAELPNVLIVYFQRLRYNYEIDRNEKINSRMEFPAVLDLKKYSIEELMRKNVAARSNGTESFEENDEMYFKNNSYYEYDLVGVNVHMGSADSGHYFSYINTIRNGENDCGDFDRSNPSHKKSWLKFNDSHISKFNIDKLESECFGGQMNEDSYFRGMENSQSAYMLIYERKNKFPSKVVLEETKALDLIEKIKQNTSSDLINFVSYKEEEILKIQRQNNFFTYEINSNDFKTGNQLLKKTLFHDIARNEYYTYQNYYKKDVVIPKEYFCEVFSDNQNFHKQKTNSDDSFAKFLAQIGDTLNNTLEGIKFEPEEASIVVIKLCNFMICSLCSVDKKEMLKSVSSKISNIIQQNPLLALEVAKCFFINEGENFKIGIINEDEDITKNYVKLTFSVVECLYNYDKDNLIEANAKKMYGTDCADLCVKILDFIIHLFPKIPRSYYSSLQSIYTFFKQLTQFGDIMIEYLIQKEFITIFICFLIGKDSPYYSGYESKYKNYHDYNRCYPAGSNSIIDCIFELFKYKVFFYLE